ncbi:MAG: NUDIX hydrolase [Gammaproteobacteria bacterium]|nr:NUDIX hydrolase [Gammaproteobacteria bacterium]
MPVPKTPLLAADVIIELEAAERGIVLIERRYPPHGWALPGGFVDIGETVERAAVREAWEETSLAVTLRCLLGCYSDPGRDPRGHTVSLVFVATATGEPQARDDARGLRVVDPAAIGERLAFDHARIVDDYLRYRASGRSPAWFPRGVGPA